MSGSAAQEDSKNVAATMTKLRWLNRPFMENNLKTPLTRLDEPGAVFQLKRDARSLQGLETCGDR
jgi:hypothetical protein